MQKTLFSISSWRYIHQSAITLNPLTGEMNDINYLITVAPVKGSDTLDSK